MKEVQVVEVIVFPEGRSARVFFHSDVSDSDSATDLVDEGNLFGPRVLLVKP